MRRPGIWVANGHPGDPALMLSWRPGALTCFYDYLGINGVFGYKAAHPDAPIIIRFQHPVNWQQNPTLFARQLGEQVASKWSDIQRLDPYVYFANEVNLHYENGDPNAGNQARYETREFYQQYAAWVRMTAEVIKNRVPEMKLITPPFAFGHHEDGAPDDTGNPTEGWAGYDYLYETIRDYFNNIITFHAYWGNAGGSVPGWLYDPQLSSWYAFRWRRVLKMFKTRYKLDARVIIDEAGNFAASDPDFTDQVIYFAENSLKDGRVIALTYFLWLDPTNSPGNLPNSWVQRIRNLNQHLARLQAMPDVLITEYSDGLTPERTIRVLFDDGHVETMPLEEYLRAVVPAEMPALWPPEAVKAQAVAARSYAQYTIEHPRHPNADVCTTSHCQNYNPAKIHARSDEAIRLTNDIVARYNGQTINAVFSANCGGHTRNNEDVFQGTPVPYLRGVPCPDPGPKNGHGVGFCQYGARAFAQQGQTYDNIIKHYYTGVTLGPPTTVVTSTILGLILAHTGQPAANIRLVLRGANQAAETVTRADGTYRFSNVPAGTYVLEVPDYQVRQENINPTPGQDLTINLTLPDPATLAITAEIQRGPGLPLIVGNWSKANVPIVVRPPAGPAVTVMSGSKPEYGPGGFEVYTDQSGVYVLEIEAYRFEIPMAGQFTRLTFRRGPAPLPQAIVEGSLTDFQNRPVANRVISLTGAAGTLTATTDTAGRFRFESLAAGNYSLTVADSDISRSLALTGTDHLNLALQLPAPPPTDWTVDLQRGSGLPLLVGDIGVASEPITITSPRGLQARVTSGSKPEWGIGGFEMYAQETGNYLVQFLGQTFTIPMTGQFTRATFRRGAPPPEEQVRLVSTALPRSRAETILRATLESSSETRGLFQISTAE